MSIDIVRATSPDQIATARMLFKEYEASLGIELTFQSFAREVAELPGTYEPPAGRLFLAEQISVARWIGIALIMTGVALVGRTAHSTTGEAGR